jgi:urease accessory protein
MPAAMVSPNMAMLNMVMLNTIMAHMLTMTMIIMVMRTMIRRRTIIRMIMDTPTITAIIITMKNIASMSIITANPMLMTTNKPPAKARRAAVKDQIEPSAQVAASPVEGADKITNGEAAALYRLMTWLSPSFPVGAFSYSSGIEWAVEAGDIVDAASLRQWLAALLADGPGFCDGVFLAQAYRAAIAGDHAGLREIAELAAAFAPSRERHLETSTQGRAFIEIARSAWNCEGLGELISACDGIIVYPVAVGIVSAAHAIPLAPAMHAFFHAVVSNWISAGARLVPLGQTDSQRVLAALEPVVAATATRALKAALDDLGSTTFRADLASLRHETQYTRLFRS